jgi:hypothetical protein
LLRRLAANDPNVQSEMSGSWLMSSLRGQARAQAEDEGEADVRFGAWFRNTAAHLFEQIAHHVMRTTYQRPTLVVPDGHPMVAAVTRAYLEARTGPAPQGCNAAGPMRAAFWDMLTLGIGWVWPTTGLAESSRPIVREVDATRVVYDPYTTLVANRRWEAVRLTAALSEWTRIFGRAAFAEESETGEDEPFEMVVYWDTHGDGSEMWFKSQKLANDDSLVEASINPYYEDWDGYRAPCLPLQPVQMVEIPGVAYPVGLAGAMSPHAYRLAQIESYLTRTVEAGKPYWEVEAGALDERARGTFERGDIGAIVEYQAGRRPPNRVAGLEVPQTTLALMEIQERALRTASGVTEMDQGGAVRGAKFMGEVAEISARSNTKSTWLAMQAGDHWERVMRRLLWLGSQYDIDPLVLEIDGERLAFGVHDPVGDYLDPYTTLVVEENSTQYETSGARQAKASQRLQTAMTMAQAYPNALRLEYEHYLRQSGVANTAPYFEAPVELTGTGLSGSEPLGEQIGQ